MIQLGLSFANEKGELPENGCCTWQFNFAFNLRYLFSYRQTSSPIFCRVWSVWVRPARPGRLSFFLAGQGPPWEARGGFFFFLLTPATNYGRTMSIGYECFPRHRSDAYARRCWCSMKAARPGPAPPRSALSSPPEPLSACRRLLRPPSFCFPFVRRNGPQTITQIIKTTIACLRRRFQRGHVRS